VRIGKVVIDAKVEWFFLSIYKKIRWHSLAVSC